MTMVNMHNVDVHKLCINTIMNTKTGKTVKKKTRNSYILHKNLVFEIIAKKGGINLSYMLCCGRERPVLQYRKRKN